MSKPANAVTGYNASNEIFPAFTPVAIGSRIDASGISDDMCFAVSKENIANVSVIGITSSDLYPGMPGKVIVSGIANTVLPEFFYPGDRIAPDDNGNWYYSETGCAVVINRSGDDGVGMVYLGSKVPDSKTYRGHFKVDDTSSPNSLSIEVNGGTTDLGQVMNRAFEINSSVQVYLMAEYIRGSDGSGSYVQTITIDPAEKTSDEYALWLLADVQVRTHLDGTKYLNVIQQWQSGEIYWGSRFWI